MRFTESVQPSEQKLGKKRQRYTDGVVYHDTLTEAIDKLDDEAWQIEREFRSHVQRTAGDRPWRNGR